MTDIPDTLVLKRHRDLTGAFLVIFTFALLQVLVSWLGYRLPRTRPALEGHPLIVVDDGELIENNLRRERLTPEEVAEAARQNGIAHLSEVRWAVLETTGSISFIKKSA